MSYLKAWSAHYLFDTSHMKSQYPTFSMDAVRGADLIQRHKAGLERALPMWFLTRIPLLSLHIFSRNWAPELLHPSITGLGNKICWILYSQSKKMLPIAYLSIWVVTLNAFWIGISVRHLCFCAFFSGPLLAARASTFKSNFKCFISFNRVGAWYGKLALVTLWYTRKA